MMTREGPYGILRDAIHRSAWKEDSTKFAKEVSKITHLRDAPASQDLLRWLR